MNKKIEIWMNGINRTPLPLYLDDDTKLIKDTLKQSFEEEVNLLNLDQRQEEAASTSTIGKVDSLQNYKFQQPLTQSELDLFNLTQVEPENLDKNFFKKSEIEEIIEFYDPEEKIILTESETFFMLDIPSLVVDIKSPEADAIIKENEHFLFVRQKNNQRHKVDEETQTDFKILKNKATLASKFKTSDKGSLASTWNPH